jgi:hypothetical protein
VKPVPPSTESISFSCPHCGAHADQFWFNLHAKEIDDHGVPFRFDTAEFAKFKVRDKNLPKDAEGDKYFEEVAQRTENGDVFFQGISNQGVYGSSSVVNLQISRCYSCKNLSVWIDRRVAYPVTNFDGVPPNEDLPPDIKRDFNEARAILSASPRGAAALLRLCIQKVCKQLGEPGENINSDIASLVKKGLDVRVQQALDIVRVIGNDSVHPGQIDLRDDPATAARLFELVNLIAERMISEPRRVDEMFNALPEAKKSAIEARDKPKPAE